MAPPTFTVNVNGGVLMSFNPQKEVLFKAHHKPLFC